MVKYDGFWLEPEENSVIMMICSFFGFLRRKNKMKNMILAFSLLVLAIPCKAEIIVVDPNGSADFNNIQDAIDHSLDGDIIVVSPGTYTENVYFNSAAVILTNLDPNDPNIVQSTIVTSNSGYSVNFDFLEGGDSVITGFTITNRGICCEASAPTITKNVIRDCNTSGVRGYNLASPTISFNTIMGNLGPSGGGGIYACHGTIRNNTILANRSGGGGGLETCNGTISGNTISANTGAGLDNCDGTIINNIISGNRDSGLSGCNGTIINNTIVGNRYQGIDSCSGIVKNNIIAMNRNYGLDYVSQNNFNDVWNNNPSNFGDHASAGPGDIGSNPLFAVNGYWDSNDVWVDGDYHVLSEAGRWDSNSQSWLLNDWTSRCIDTGDPNSDWSSELWPHGKRINMGAYGGTPEASMSILSVGNKADLNNDDIVNLRDFAYLAGSWQTQEVLLREDLNRDRYVDILDLRDFVDNWLWEQ